MRRREASCRAASSSGGGWGRRIGARRAGSAGRRAAPRQAAARPALRRHRLVRPCEPGLIIGLRTGLWRSHELVERALLRRRSPEVDGHRSLQRRHVVQPVRLRHTTAAVKTQPVEKGRLQAAALTGSSSTSPGASTASVTTSASRPGSASGPSACAITSETGSAGRGAGRAWRLPARSARR